MPESPGSIQSMHGQIGRAFLQLEIGLVAARRGIDLVAFGFEIVAQQQRQRLLVLDDQYAGRHSALDMVARHGHIVGHGHMWNGRAVVVVSPFGRSSAIGRPSTM